MAFKDINGYRIDEHGYVISKGSIPSKVRPGYVTVWSAFTALPPEGERIMNGSDMFFYTEWEAVAACYEHEQRGRVAA